MKIKSIAVQSKAFGKLRKTQNTQTSTREAGDVTTSLYTDSVSVCPTVNHGLYDEISLIP